MSYYIGLKEVTYTFLSNRAHSSQPIGTVTVWYNITRLYCTALKDTYHRAQLSFLDTYYWMIIADVYLPRSQQMVVLYGYIYKVYKLHIQVHVSLWPLRQTKASYISWWPKFWSCISLAVRWGECILVYTVYTAHSVYMTCMWY